MINLISLDAILVIRVSYLNTSVHWIVSLSATRGADHLRYFGILELQLPRD